MDKKIWSCRVVHVKEKEGEVFINAGRESGVSIGLMLNVTHPGMEIKDPATGKIIGYDEIPIGRIKVERSLAMTGLLERW